MSSREHTKIVAVADDAIVIDDLVGLALLDGGQAGSPILWANPAFSSQLDRGHVEVVGRRLDQIIDHPELRAALADVVPGGEQTLRLATGGGTGVVLQLSATGVAAQVLVVARPAHSTARAAMFDAVTGLAALDLFREHLQLGLHRRQRDGDDVAVIAVGAPRFAAAWQEREGPASVLQSRISERLEQVVRASDVLAARRPGSFLLLVVDPADAVAAATLVAERMLAAFESPLVLPERLQRIQLCMGIASALPDDEPEHVIARADRALGRAAEAGPDVYRVELD
jgi:diguanylate cyclase (GGDEF)-like protein